MPLYLVGGPVRDLLLGRQPSDLDLVVEGDAPRLASYVAGKTDAKVVLHRRFGTASVRVGKERLDLATARREVYERPGALPKVTGGSIEEDLLRRDFTINAVALGLAGPRSGELLDPSLGVSDLDKGLVRTLHAKSFEDDATRVFRAVRYEQRLSLSLEGETLGRLAKALEMDMLATVSADRLRRELALVLSEERAVETTLRAGALGVLSRLYPPLKDASWMGRFPEGSGGAQPLTLVAGLAYPMSHGEAEGFVRRLNMPSSWGAAARDMARLTGKAAALEAPELPATALYRMLEGRSAASVEALRRLTPSRAAQERLAEYLERLRFVKPILRGEDLASLGVGRGPRVGEVLRLLLEERLEGRALTREEERNFVLNHLKSHGGEI